ncbi:hypothetical protein [Crocosphaera watsonii]|uniref:Uncharacterized protein n=2 Tax=Crocosphaera watsonii TaxID=263511 RepID=T2JXL8_CROWT|nr:hypothetical protein [Crocosphaera watsonii]CCQ55667.1 hypothetical protein CWATWH0005_5049 [Crocosphaera watsonii WH 0005]CCQ69776.1 hypothetical protein CWATWH0402_1068 [Crocosphaera watsonii WH 0402]
MKPCDKTLEQNLFTYQKRKVIKDNFVEFYDCALLVYTDIFEPGSHFDLIQIDYTTMKALLWVNNNGEQKHFFEYEISIGLA